MSELNWRYVSVQAGLGKNVKVGQEAGKSVQVCIASNENPLKGHVARLQAQGSGLVKESNVLPMTLSPRVPAPAVGGVPEGRLIGKGAKRSIKRTLSEDDKENDLPVGTGSLKKKATIGKRMPTRTTAQQAFPDIPEEQPVEEEPVKPRRLLPPERKPSGSGAPQTATIRASAANKPNPVISHAPLTRSVATKELEQKRSDEMISSGAKRTLRGTKATEAVERPPTQAEINVPSRVPSQVQVQRATLRRTAAQDNLKRVHPLCIFSDFSLCNQPPTKFLFLLLLGLYDHDRQ